MDDILIIHNEDTNFIKNTLINVYNNCLELEITHKNEYLCNYLDLTIYINNNIIFTKQYKKTEEFKYQVIKYPHWDSKIPLSIKKATIYTEVLRLARTTTQFNEFIERIGIMKSHLYDNNYKAEDILSSIFKCIHKDKFITLKYCPDQSNKSLYSIIKKLF